MPIQSEAILENNLIKQLVKLNYERVKIHNEKSVLENLLGQLGKFNTTIFSQKEFDRILLYLRDGNVFEKAKKLRDRYLLQRDNGDTFYVRFFNTEYFNKNLFQVTNQVTQEGTYKTRYDVTLLLNGIPIVQIELKRRGLGIKEAFNQIVRYKRHSFWTNNGLFQFVQLFVISNGVNTKYYVNNPITTLSYKQSFKWANAKNKNITDLTEFADSFLRKPHLSKILAQYIVHNETFKMLMVLRPYQYYATESIVHQVKNKRENGYIWHTTGSGKTLTSFKASQIIMDLPNIHKVVFVVDRKDLDYQTMKEFNSFKKDSVDVTDNTRSLVKQFTDNTKLILTTIQKLNNAVGKTRFESQMKYLMDKRIVFIFDECHRSQFGATHKRITSFFKNSQLFGFTGTPIFADNAAKNEMGKRTTKDLFGECLHKYVITDAIRDQNVLKFSIEYVGRYKQNNTFIDIDVEAIDKQEVFDDVGRLEKIVDYIIQYHDVKTHRREHTAIFATSSIQNLIQYYEIFREKKEAGEHDLRIATIFSYSSNEDDQQAIGFLPEENLSQAAEPIPNYVSSHSRDKLESFIGDYNQMYGTKFITKDSRQYENYFKDISKRIKDREKMSFNEKDRVDILLVVNMFLTGFDAKKVNTIYVDKNLRFHGLIQAFSRTNRILNEKKSQGNILSFRNLKKNVDEAVTLFSNKNALEEIFIPPYEVILQKFISTYNDLMKLVPTLSSIDELQSEDDQLAFVKAFRALIRLKNVLASFTEFSWDDIPVEEQVLNDYTSKYLDLRDSVKQDHAKEKVSILDDVDFELELIHRDEINVAYIISLLAKLKQAKASDYQLQRKAIMDMMRSEIELRSKRELIEQFIEENLPEIDDVDSIPDEFERYWNDQRILALAKLCEEENLDQEQFQALIDAYIYSEQEPIRDEVFKCLDNRPSILQARTIGERIINKMKEYVQVFMIGLTG